MPVLLFDMFGTLADPESFTAALEGRVRAAHQVSQAWRRHQLEISWLVSVADRYEDWTQITAWGLDAALQECDASLADSERARVLEEVELPRLFPDVTGAIEKLAARGHTLAVFSNGTQKALSRIVSEYGLSAHIDEVISCDEVRVYKPSPVTYRHALARVRVEPGDVWLVSANPFDCAGAKAFGLRVAKVERQPTPVYGFASPPDRTVKALDALADALPT